MCSQKKLTFISILCVFSLLSVRTLADSSMKFNFSSDGKIEAYYNGKQYISSSNIGLIIKNKQILEPTAMHQHDNSIIIDFDKSSKVTLEKKIREDGSVRLEVTACSKDIDAFIFGPYVCPDTKLAGESIGAAWHEDGSAVCIQGLNTKTIGECVIEDSNSIRNLEYTNTPSFVLPASVAAGLSDDKYVLSCKVINFTKPFVSNTYPGGFKNITMPPLPAPEGSIEGAAIILTCASNSDELLDQIGKIEIEEGLPHPMINGQWAKKSPHANDIYLIFGSGNITSKIELAKRAGVNCVYMSDPFKSWGHFEINKNLFPGGEKQFNEEIKNAKDKGINVGFHTLSNFMHTYDPYVTPIPSKDLLALDPTKITQSISAEDTNIFIADTLNYGLKQNLSSVRIGDEIIRFSTFDKDSRCLVSCTRGAFGTKASAHKKGEIITHLVDGDYMVFFPNFKLQNEMADRIGTIIKESGIRRMSFDGLEACCRTYGRYAINTFVERVYKLAGNDLISDASGPSHYTWHAHSYFNWGEPWYDYQRRGGMYNNRVRNNDFFKRNLLPTMLGWFGIFDNKGSVEATMPETIESILSRTIAFNGGLCFQTDLLPSDKLSAYMDLINIWQKFKSEVNVPQPVLDRMKEEKSDWHLERKEGTWILSEMSITDYDLTYCDKTVKTESRTTGYASTDESMKQSMHRSNIVIDRSSPDPAIPYIDEPFHCRIRVGTPFDHGKIHNLSFSPGWFDSEILLSFDVLADAGDYLEYNGGTVLYRYDKDYNFIEKIDGKGAELVVTGDRVMGFTVNYDIVDELPGEKPMIPMLKYIRTKQSFVF